MTNEEKPRRWTLENIDGELFSKPHIDSYEEVIEASAYVEMKSKRDALKAENAKLKTYLDTLEDAAKSFLMRTVWTNHRPIITDGNSTIYSAMEKKGNLK